MKHVTRGSILLITLLCLTTNTLYPMTVEGRRRDQKTIGAFLTGSFKTKEEFARQKQLASRAMGNLHWSLAQQYKKPMQQKIAATQQSFAKPRPAKQKVVNHKPTRTQRPRTQPTQRRQAATNSQSSMSPAAFIDYVRNRYPIASLLATVGGVSLGGYTLWRILPSSIQDKIKSMFFEPDQQANRNKKKKKKKQRTTTSTPTQSTTPARSTRQHATHARSTSSRSTGQRAVHVSSTPVTQRQRPASSTTPAVQIHTQPTRQHAQPRARAVAAESENESGEEDTLANLLQAGAQVGERFLDGENVGEDAQRLAARGTQLFSRLLDAEKTDDEADDSQEEEVVADGPSSSDASSDDSQEDAAQHNTDASGSATAAAAAGHADAQAEDSASDDEQITADLLEKAQELLEEAPEAVRNGIERAKEFKETAKGWGRKAKGLWSQFKRR